MYLSAADNQPLKSKVSAQMLTNTVENTIFFLSLLKAGRCVGGCLPLRWLRGLKIAGKQTHGAMTASLFS